MLWCEDGGGYSGEGGVGLLLGGWLGELGVGRLLCGDGEVGGCGVGRDVVLVARRWDILEDHCHYGNHL
ncbi:hypothetical protein Tco_0664615 [Tanacetum coccineum]